MISGDAATASAIRRTEDSVHTAAAGTAADLSRARAVSMFLAFALAYFFSALVRAVVATLAPAFKLEFGLGAADLGLLAGAYFLGFAALQLPMGSWLDRYGPKRVLVGFLVMAVAGCAAFAVADGLGSLVAARVAIGMGVAACLMAPLTAFRRWFSEAAQLRCSSWMLMTGSLGMLASTLPVQWLVPFTGWRGLFWILAGAFVVAALGIAWVVPSWRARRETGAAPHASVVVNPQAARPGYAAIWREPYFRAMAPLAFFLYGGLVAVQTLWAGPWLTQVAGLDAAGAARGLFLINSAMLATFLAWGSVTPRLMRLGWGAPALVARGVPLALVLLAINVLAGASATAPWWALWCVSCTVVSLTQPYVAQQVEHRLAGRALSAYNLVIFVGVFAVQWALGGIVQGLGQLGWDVKASYQGAFALFWLCCTLAYLWFLRTTPRGSLHRGAVRNAADASAGSNR